MGKLVVILAGYDADMNNLLRVNEGLSSRFADEIIFLPLRPENALQLLESRLRQSQITMPSLGNPHTYQECLEPIAELSRLPAWGNARDVQTLAKSMVRAVYLNCATSEAKVDQLHLPHDIALRCIDSMLSDRRSRNNTVPSTTQPDVAPFQYLDNPQRSPAPQFITSTATAMVAPEAAPGEEMPLPTLTTPQPDSRDSGVSDATWAQLEKDKLAAKIVIENHERMVRDQEEAIRQAQEAEKKAEEEAAVLRAVAAKNEAEANELLRKREEARIREMEAKAVRERIQKELERRQKKEQERRRLEQQAQAKLREMGICPAGFRWIKQIGGYRCSAGGHWVTDGQLGL